MGERRPIVSFLAILLLAAHIGLLLHCAATDFATFDEAGHLVAGVYAWETGSHHLYSVNPPLTKLLAAGPVLLARPDTHSVLMYDFPGARPELDIGDSFAHVNAAHFPRLLFLARLAGVGWSVLGGWLVFRWSRRLFGDAGGLLSLAVWCFEPNIIAHAHLATPDVPAAVAACAAMITFNGYLRAPSWPAACWAGVALGVAQLCKFTLVILYPLWLLIAACSGRWGMAVVGWKARLGQLVLVFASSLFVLNMGYEFSGSFQRLQDYTFTSQMLTNGGSAGNRFHDTWLGAIRVPLPEDL